MSTGSRRQLELDDLWALDGDDSCARACAALKTNLDLRGGSVLKAVLAAYGPKIALCGAAALFSTACSVFAPVVLHHFIDAFTAPQLDVKDLSLWLGIFFASRLLNVAVLSQMQFRSQLIALRLTGGLKSLLYEKSLRRRVGGASEDDKAADIVNLFTADMTNILWAAVQVNNLWILPLQVAVITYLLFTVLGLAALAGLIVILLSMIAGFSVALASGTAFRDILTNKDERMKAIKEGFGAIAIVKFNAWEGKFGKNIKNLRFSELQAVSRYLYIVALSIFVMWCTPIIVSTASFAVYTLVLGNHLTAAKVFTAMALFNGLRNPLRDLPDVIQQSIQAKISFERVFAFLMLPEVDLTNVARVSTCNVVSAAILIKNASFGWDAGDNTLMKVSVCVRKGDLAVVYGPVGSGKSSLCAAIAGEMKKRSGENDVCGRIAVCSQVPWLQNKSIRQNILFGREFDPIKYRQVIYACGLVTDFESFPARDDTEVGQKGANLSGGQRARIELARACYSDADIFILDSTLAALDAIVRSQIFQECICGLLRGKTVVLVTHDTDIIASDFVNCRIRVESGRAVSSKRSLIAKPGFASQRSRTMLAAEAAGRQRTFHSETTCSAGQLVEEESRGNGRVAWGVYSAYLRSAGGIRVWTLLLLVQIMWQAFQIGSDLWLSHWTSHNGDGEAQAVEVDDWHGMRIYAALGAGSAVMVLIRSFTIAAAGLLGARDLFNGMTHALLRAPIRFFDVNPIGRIVNRYGDDISTVDFTLPFAFGTLLAVLFFTLCQLVVAVYMVNFVGLLIVPLAILYVRTANFYLRPSRDISRLWKISSSPVLSHISEAEDGTTVLRAFGTSYVDRSIRETQQLIDTNNRVWVAMTAIGQWFQVRIQLIGCGVVIVVVSALIYLRSVLSPGLIGLAFTYALSVDANLAGLVRSWSLVEVSMVGPERILDYTSIPSEGDGIVRAPPGREWPVQGTVVFDNVVFCYTKGGSPALNCVRFTLFDKEKVGIVGRTGAGKSSLIMALFRMGELSSGRIAIDGVDIATVPLQALRSRLSIIPQTPVLFSGSLRAFMDPFDDFSDVEIWDALAKVEMRSTVAALRFKLHQDLRGAGDALSAGERQMLYLARALLMRSRVVVLDEATASIDQATEQKLQTMIAREFRDATVLTIAHRLATVLSSDRVMVLSAGRVIEFDAPAKLMADPHGAFHKLASGCDSGDTLCAHAA